jgi:DNA adenine methylase
MKAILKYPGSKWRIAQWIISHFPPGYEKMTYLEPYFGSGAVFFNKNRSTIETINDLSDDVINLFRVIREHPEELARLIEMTPWSRSEYKQSYITTGESVEDARRFLVRMWQAIGAKSSDITGWRNNIKANNGNLTQFNNRLPTEILEVAQRLKHSSGGLVQIDNQDAIKEIERHNRENVLIYIDPPYVRSTRSGRIYKHEYTDVDHIDLLQAIMRHKGKIILSGYDCDLYNNTLQGWIKSSRISTTELGRKRIEVLWMNYKPCLEQTNLILQEASL